MYVVNIILLLSSLYLSHLKPLADHETYIKYNKNQSHQIQFTLLF